MTKKFFSLTLLIFSLSVITIGVKSQSLTFCESVDANGNPVSSSSLFYIGSGGGYLDMLVNINYDLNCYSVRYEIYKVSSNGSESYSTTITQSSKPDWRWFYKEVTFYDEGKYNVYVYDCNDYLLTSGSVRIQFR